MQLKAWIKAARQHAGLTQEKLAEKIGRTKANVSSWEAGRHRPSIQQAQDIARITGYPFLEMEVAQVAATPWPFELVSLASIEALSPAQRGYVEKAMLDSLAELDKIRAGAGERGGSGNRLAA